jgi:hypothetical protein
LTIIKLDKEKVEFRDSRLSKKNGGDAVVLAVVVALFSSGSSCSKFRRRIHERKAIENEELQKIRFDILVIFDIIKENLK